MRPRPLIAASAATLASLSAPTSRQTAPMLGPRRMNDRGRDGEGRRRGRDECGETLALLILWPMLLVSILLLLVHAFIVTNAQAEAEVAASAGLRAAWRTAANEDFLSVRDNNGIYQPDAYGEITSPGVWDVPAHAAPHPAVLDMASAAEDAAARAAGTRTGWRWWTPGATVVHSDWCSSDPGADPNVVDRPGQGDSGWVRVVVSGEVFGPLAALWPDRLDRVHAAATGPAVLISPQQGQQELRVPADLPEC